MQEDGSLLVPVLGLAVERGERPQVTVPAGVIFGAEVVEPDSFCLVSCVVSPGFDPRDFELFAGAELLQRYPEQAALIRRFCGEETKA